MIQIEHLSKSFDNTVIFHDFSYTFCNTGFYLLFGESGSGKTTLLNIIAGLVSFDNGCVSIDSTSFTEMAAPNKSIEYMTQDCSFINFLTMEENLKLVSEEKEIHKWAEQFGLSKLLDSFPMKLSGGERQRFAFIRALLNKKNIFLLDEPTASLDEENARKVFSQFAELKKDALIICTSHDPIARQYADHIVEISKIQQIESVEHIPSHSKTLPVSVSMPITHSNSSIPYPKKWIRSSLRSKKSDYLFLLFMTVAFMICCFATPPQYKLDATMRKSYHINSVQFVGGCDGNWSHLFQSDPRIAETVLSYYDNVPMPEIPTERHEVLQSPDYEIQAFVLPYQENLCRISDKIAYGTYFSDMNQIILTKEAAEAMSPSFPYKLIGKSIKKKFYNIGTVELEIVGILDELNDFDRAYLNSFGCNFQYGNRYNPDDSSRMYFVSSHFSEQFIDDSTFQTDGKRCWYFVFHNYKDAKSFYTQYMNSVAQNGGALSINKSVSDIQHISNLLFIIMLPVCFVIAFFTLIFYCSNIFVETAYQSSFLSVFEHLGYSVKRVRFEYRLIHFVWLSILVGASLTIAISLVSIVNLANQILTFIPFHFITPYPLFIAAFSALVLLGGYIILYLYIKKVRHKNWYQILTQNRDLL